MASIKARRQVSILTKLSYGSGHSLLSAKNMLFHFFFLFFFANVMGIAKPLVIFATFAALMVDAFSDPIMGQISDNYRSQKWGRRHRFMLWSIIPTGLFLVLLFSPPEFLGPTGLFIWMLTFTILVRLGLTVYGVPYWSLGGELSTDYNERTNIISVRELFNNLFNLVVMICGFLIFLVAVPGIEDGMMNKAGYSPFAMTMAIMGIIGAVITVYGTKHKIPDIERFTHDKRTRWTDTFANIKTAARIKPFVWLTTGYSILLILYGASSALSVYLGSYLWGFSNPEKFLVALAPFLVLPITVTLPILLAAKIDKKPAVLLLTGIYVFFSILPYALYLLGMLPPIDAVTMLGGVPMKTNLILICFFSGFGFMGFVGVLVVAFSMLADVADEMERNTSKRQEGVLFAAFSFAQKMTFAVGTAVAGIILVIIDFPDGALRQDVPEAVITGLAFWSMIIAVIFGLVSLFAFARYTLNRERLAEIQTQLNQRAVD